VLIVVGNTCVLAVFIFCMLAEWQWCGFAGFSQPSHAGPMQRVSGL
jgi:hypothetical protein